MTGRQSTLFDRGSLVPRRAQGPESQSALILAALQRGVVLTPKDALRRFGCLRLAARVWGLRQRGHAIETEMVTVGDAVVAAYRMEVE